MDPILNSESSLRLIQPCVVVCFLPNLILQERRPFGFSLSSLFVPRVKRSTWSIIMKENKIRVAVVSQSMNIGGGEIMAARLATYIDKEKFYVKLFIISKIKYNQISNILDRSGIEYECLGLPTSFDYKSYKKFSRALLDFRPDIIHEHLDACYSWIWCILHNKPLIATMHSDPYRRQSKRVAAVIKLKSLQGNLKIIGCSKMTRDLVQRCYNIKNNQMGYIYNPISVSEFKLSEKCGDTFEFVALGRLSEVKNYPLMINAFKKVLSVHDNIHLSIAGVGPLDEALKKLVSDLNLEKKISFLGNVEDVPQLLKNSNALLLSSFSEACPMVVIEAMAAGLPIIATKVGGVPELVYDNGFLVESGDVKGFAASMVKLIEDNDLFRNMSQKSYMYASRYDKDTISKEYEDQYYDLTSK